MNDMSAPHSAARLSEDIGDVLSAIRRLIAEDEALDYARVTLERSQPAGDAEDDDPRAEGPAALARRLVRDGAALRERVASQGARPIFTEHPLAAAPRRLAAHQDTPSVRAPHAELVACRDLPPRRDPSPTGDGRGLAPLRLGDSDRVDSTLLGARKGAEIRVAPVVMAVVGDPAVDDFAEAFGAKARMRPDLVEEPTEAGFEAEVGGQPGVEAVVTCVEAQAGDATDFWAAYLQAEPQAQTDDALQVLNAGTDAGEVVAVAADAPQDPAAMAIPSWLTTALMPAEPVEATTTDAADGSGADAAVLPQSGAGDAADTIGTAVPLPDVEANIEMAPAAELAPEADSADDDEIRTMIRELIQEELHGELGQRFSRNLRAVIRREVANAIDDHLERI